MHNMLTELWHLRSFDWLLQQSAWWMIMDSEMVLWQVTQVCCSPVCLTWLARCVYTQQLKCDQSYAPCTQDHNHIHSSLCTLFTSAVHISQPIVLIWVQLHMSRQLIAFMQKKTVNAMPAGSFTLFIKCLLVNAWSKLARCTCITAGNHCSFFMTPSCCLGLVSRRCTSIIPKINYVLTISSHPLHRHALGWLGQPNTPTQTGSLPVFKMGNKVHKSKMDWLWFPLLCLIPISSAPFAS